MIQDNKPTVTVQGNLYDGPIPSMVTETDLKVSVERELVTQAEEEDMDALLGKYVLLIFLCPDVDFYASMLHGFGYGCKCVQLPDSLHPKVVGHWDLLEKDFKDGCKL